MGIYIRGQRLVEKVEGASLTKAGYIGGQGLVEEVKGASLEIHN